MLNSTTNTYTLKREIFKLFTKKFQNIFPNQKESLPLI